MPVLALIACLGLLAAPSAQNETPKDFQIFLCTEDSLTGSGKMVYAYISGEKTECMSEHELRATLNEASLRQTRDSLAREQRKLSDEVVRAIARGERNLPNAQIRMADLMNVALDGATLSNANLANADLRNASLVGANLRNANLSIAYCKGADFTAADLTGATLNGAYLNGANFTEAKGLSMDMLESAQTLHTAKFDPELASRIAEELPEKLEKPREGWINNRWAPDTTYTQQEERLPH